MAGRSSFVAWLVTAGAGPAAVALPVNWAAAAIAGVARRWWSELRGKDALADLVRGAVGDGFDLSDDEFAMLRELLLDEATWGLVEADQAGEEDRERSVAVLTTQVARCMPPRPGRSKTDSELAAVAVAVALLELVVRELDPAMFQRVVLARLERMEKGTASLFEERLRGLHADLYSDTVEMLARQGELSRQHYRSIVGHVDRLAERLPPRRAARAELRVYLERVVAWLDDDPWLERSRGRQVAPSLIERTLRVRAALKGDDESLVAADDVAQRCHRLVILAGPGAGKTWLAKRLARRCAERALDALQRAANLSEVEVPLYMTCRDLLTASGNINEAVAAAAVDHLGDLGPSRRVEAIRRFLADRVAPMLVVVDSLDEAAGAANQDRLRQLDSVDWRVVLTTRPGAWAGQLRLDSEDPAHLEGRLEPLSYPGDVHGFIHRWFDSDPEAARALIAQIDDRVDLQTSTTVPLLLAFYCILGGSEPLPRFRRDLYNKLINRLLSGSWRTPYAIKAGGIDIDELRTQLQTWAWQAAKRDPCSGLGDWDDEITTATAGLPDPALNVLDHLATAVTEPDPDTWEVRRRFIHRTIVEHLVAAHLADQRQFPTEAAADELLAHLWYDPDWEYAAPTAVAARSDRDRLLRLLLARAAPTPDPPQDLTVIDGGGEIHRFLARLAIETHETDWASDTARLIGQARLRLVQDDDPNLIAATYHWTTTNTPVRTQLLQQFIATDAASPSRLLSVIVRLARAADEKAVTREAILDLLPNTSRSSRPLLSALMQLEPTSADKRQARTAVIGLLATDESGRWLVSALPDLDPTPADQAAGRSMVLHRLTTEPLFAHLVSILMRLDPTSEDRAAARTSLVGHLAEVTDSDPAEELVLGLVALATEPEDRTITRDVLIKQLAHADRGQVVEQLILGLLDLDLTPADRARARTTLIERIVTPNRWIPSELVLGLVQLASTPEDLETVRAAILNHLTSVTEDGVMWRLLSALVVLHPTSQDEAAARALLLERLATTSEVRVHALVSLLVELHPTSQDEAAARALLLERLATTSEDRALVSLLVELHPTSQDEAAARALLLERLVSEDWGAEDLTSALLGLNPSPQDQAAARALLLTRLASVIEDWTVGSEDGREEVHHLWDEMTTRSLVSGLMKLNPDSQDRTIASDLLLRCRANVDTPDADWIFVPELTQLVHTPQSRAMVRAAAIQGLTTVEISRVRDLVSALMELDPSSDDKAQARAALLDRFVGTPGERVGDPTVSGLVALGMTPQDKAVARTALLDGLSAATKASVPGAVSTLVQLDPSPDDKAMVRTAIVNRLTSCHDAAVARKLMSGLIKLDPTPQDLIANQKWPARCSHELLQVVRRNANIEDWLRVLPHLS